MAAMKLYNHTCRCIIHTVCKKISENLNTYIKISFVTNSDSQASTEMCFCVRLALLLVCRWLVGNYWVKGKEVNEKLLILVAWIVACGSKAVLTAEKVIQCETGG